MIQKFSDRYIAEKEAIISEFMEKAPDSYDDIFKRMVVAIRDDSDYRTPDPERITVIDHGDYQGSRLFVVGASGYQPSEYWATMVSYGSCSGCDSFQDIIEYGQNLSRDQCVELWTLGLHMVQNMKEIS